jgi:diacylglycerol kinase (ATP)
VPNAAILINPTSGKGRGGKNAPAAVARLRAMGVRVTELVGRSGAHSRELAQAAVADEVDALIACGGDGTVHCALQAIAGTEVTLGIIPVGTGDDIARALDLPLNDVVAAADVIAGGQTRHVDYGVVTTDDDSRAAFLAVLSAGFDSEVTARANRMTWPTGSSRYLVATMAELAVYRPVEFRITVDDQVLVREGMMLAVGNGSSYGGGMFVCPGAVVDDGVFDLTFLTRTSKLTFLRTFPGVFKGTHVKSPSVLTMRGSTVQVDAPGQTAYADGERVGPLPMKVTLVPLGLKVFANTG